MKLTRTEIAGIAIILLSFAVSLWFWPQMPDKMATHWGMQGQVNGYMPKFWGLFFMPLMQLVLGLFLWVVPRIDPLKANITKFQKYYHGFIAILLLFLLAVHLQVLLWNMGAKIDPNRFIPVSLGVLLFYTGILTEKAQRNWLVGIRTPWTLSSERVWDKTHKLGGKLFKISGIIAFIGLLFPAHAFLFIVIPVILVTLYTYVYSFLEYRKETK